MCKLFIGVVFIYLFVCLWLLWVFIASPGPSVVAVRGLLSSCSALASFVAEHELRSMPASVVVAHGLSCSLACAVFQTSDQVCVSRIGTWILYTPEPPGKPHVQVFYGRYVFIWGRC